MYSGRMYQSMPKFQVGLNRLSQDASTLVRLARCASVVVLAFWASLSGIYEAIAQEEDPPPEELDIAKTKLNGRGFVAVVAAPLETGDPRAEVVRKVTNATMGSDGPYLKDLSQYLYPQKDGQSEAAIFHEIRKSANEVDKLTIAIFEETESLGKTAYIPAGQLRFSPAGKDNRVPALRSVIAHLEDNILGNPLLNWTLEQEAMARLDQGRKLFELISSKPVDQGGIEFFPSEAATNTDEAFIELAGLLLPTSAEASKFSEVGSFWMAKGANSGHREVSYLLIALLGYHPLPLEFFRDKERIFSYQPSNELNSARTKLYQGVYGLQQKFSFHNSMWVPIEVSQGHAPKDWEDPQKRWGETSVTTQRVDRFREAIFKRVIMPAEKRHGWSLPGQKWENVPADEFLPYIQRRNIVSVARPLPRR